MLSWWCGSSVGGPAQQVPSPEVKPHHCQKKKKKKKSPSGERNTNKPRAV
jgi:hypothetical protein